MKLSATHYLLTGACLLLLGFAQPALAEATSDASEHSDAEVLTTCGMYIYSSILMQVYDLGSLENQAKSKVCGVEEQFSPAQSLEDISRLFADYGMEKTARQYNISFDDAYIKQVFSLTEIILKTYQSGYEKALRHQLAEQKDTQLYCTSFRKRMSLLTD